MPIRAVKHVAPKKGTTLSVLGDRYVFKLTGADTGGAYSLFEFMIPPGHGSPPHVHHREEEGFHITEGELTFYIGHERTRVVAGPGDYINAPRDLPHFFRNEGTVPTRGAIIIAPAGLENFFAAFGTPLPTPDSDPVPPTAEQIAKLNEIAPQYGLEILGPPPWVEG